MKIAFGTNRGSASSVRETARHRSLCAETVLQRQPLIVRDASKDPRFAKHTLVAGSQRIRSYLGIPLYTGERHAGRHALRDG